MKRTELDTINICDRLHDLSGELRVMALACNALEGDEDSGLVANMLFDMAQKVHDIGDEVHPTTPEKIREMEKVRKRIEAKAAKP